MPALLTLDLGGLRGKVAFFADMARRLEDLRPVWEDAHHLFVHEMAQQFMTQGAFLLGSQWQPLSPRYAAYKLRKYGTPPSPFGILYRTGELFSSLANEESPFHVKVLLPDSMMMGSQVYYGGFHQAGGGNLPQRKIIVLSNRFRRAVMRATVAYVTRGTTFLGRRAAEDEG